jgi:NTP pyrophosphatase (non-canonical NTP hydrolase)
MCTETGEIQDILKKSLIRGVPVDDQHLKEELGDVLWYMAVLLDEIDSSFEEVMQQNIDKLKKRYPDGFSVIACIARADKTT